MKTNKFPVTKILFLFLALTPFLAFTTAFAATIRVPSEQATIQAGIDAAVAGDTVLVADGTYTGEGNKNIDFKGKAITVQSENGAENCIVDCESAGRGFYFHQNEGYSSLISGFSIINGALFGTESGAGIYCYRSSPKIVDCIIRNNSSDDRGGGVSCSLASPEIKNCKILYNKSKGSGSGIYCTSSSPNIESSTISDNESYSNGGGIYLSSSSPNIKNCLIENNISRGEGGGISCDSDSSPDILYNKIIGNLAYNEGGGIYCGSGSSPNIDNCYIQKNLSRERGGGIYTWYSSSWITNNLISENEAPYGGGIYCNNSTSIKVINSTIANNTAYEFGGGMYCDSSESITNSIVWSNSPDEIYYWDEGPTVSYSDINGGHAGESNINTNPLFVSDTDYHLSSSSPCIDTGTSNGAPNTDIDGNPRPQGNGYDMGAYESDQSGGTRPTANAGSDQRVFDSITLDGSGSTDPDGTITSYLWDLKYQGNSSYDRTATGVNPTISTLQPGFYDVTLTVTDNQALTDTDTMFFSAIGKKGDFNGDGDVDGLDLQIFSTNYGK